MSLERVQVKSHFDLVEWNHESAPARRTDAFFLDRTAHFTKSGSGRMSVIPSFPELPGSKIQVCLWSFM